MIQQKYVLNMVPGGSPVRVHVSQYDEDSRELVFGLYSGSGSGPAFTVPDGAVVTCDGTKPDGKGFSVLADHNGDTVTVTVTKQMTAVGGETRCQLTINKDGAVLGSANFVLIAERGALDADADMSASEYSVFEDLRNQTATNAQIAQAAANEINAAQDELAAAITAAGTAKSGLETATQDAGAVKSGLETATSAANTAHGNLQEATTAAEAANDALVQPTADAQAAKTALDAANQTAQDNLAALQDADAMAQKIPLVHGAAAGNVPLLNADGSLQDSGQPLTPAGIGAAPAVESADYPGCYYRTVNGAIEWINPPMVPGVEYSTVERWNGNRVYAKCIDCGAPTDKKSVSYGVSDISKIIRATGRIGMLPVPRIHATLDNTNSYWMEFGSSSLTMYIGSSVSAASAYAEIWYTKTAS